MAVTAQPKLDAHRLRADFPIFEHEINGKQLAYLDSAVTSQKPRQMLDVMNDFYETSYGNVHRGVYALSERATAAFEGARQKLRAFVNAPDAREVIFTRNATEALNLVAYAWGLTNLGPGDIVLVTELEHHSNFVPWQYIAKRTGADFRMLPLDEHGELRLDELDPIVEDGQVKVVACNLVSNALGTVNPVERIASGPTSGARSASSTRRRQRRIASSMSRLSAATSSRSRRTRCAARAASVPSGDARELLEAMEPFNLGGHMIRKVELEETTWGDLPHKFEAGTSPIAEAVGFGAAVDYLESVGLDAIERHEHELAAYALGRLGELPWVTSYGPPAERRAGIVSFNVDGIHPHDVAQVLDFDGVAIRAGHHCCQPLMRKLGVAATNRASFYLYTIPEEIDRLVDGLHKVKKALG